MIEQAMDTMSDSKPALIDVIVPVRNERENLPVFIERLSRLPCARQLRLIFVDNASQDGSVEYLRRLRDGAEPGRVLLIEHAQDEGYGASLRDGLQAARSDDVVIIDADCEYEPEVIPRLLARLADGERVVYASRFLQRDCPAVAAMPRFKRWGNRTISRLFNLLFRQQTSDLYTGCKALRRECIEGLALQRNGFEHVLELAVLLTQRGCRIAEVPVTFAPRTAGQSKMSHLTETLKYFFWLLRYRMQYAPLRIVRRER